MIQRTNLSRGVRRNSGARNSGAPRKSTTKTSRPSGARTPRTSEEKTKPPRHKTSRPTHHQGKKSGGRNYRKPGLQKRRISGNLGDRLRHEKKTRKGIITLPDSRGDKVLRIIPVGGCEEVGRNMTIFEYDKDIIILDMGIQFPEEDMPGIDYIIPNIEYLKGREKDIKGVILSHGHLDHIGAVPILLDQLGYPVVVARDLTLAMVKHKLEDYQRGNAKKMKTIRINSLDDVVTLGNFTIKFFQVEHSIMDAVGVSVITPAGTAIHPGDWTMERDEKGHCSLDYRYLRKLPQPTVLMLESLGATNNTRHGTYEEMYKNLYDILKKAEGRIIIGTFSSQIERIKWVIKAASDLGKKIALDGYSMKNNVGIAKELGYIKPPKGVLLDDIRKIDNYPENKVVVICTGAQGEKNAVLMRIVNGAHRTIKLKKKDTIVFSSSVIPGNERSIQKLKDNLYRQCDNVIHGDVMDVHVSGHATRRDIVDMIKQIKPQYFMPVYANHYFLRESEKLAIENGFNPKNIFVPDNGSVLELDKKLAKMLKTKIPSDYVFIDGLGVSDSQSIVLRDRKVLAEDGMVVVIATIDRKTGKLVQNPDIISRGFVFLKTNKDLIEEVRQRVKRMVQTSNPNTWADTNQVKNDIRDKIGLYLMQKTNKRPMILPVVIEV